MSFNRVLTVHVIGSNSRSPKSVRLKNRTLGAFFSRRDHYHQIKDRSELSRPAVYFLIGETNDESSTNIYIGETDDFSHRIKDHLKKKDWWANFVVFYSDDFTKADVKYLEKELCIMARNSLGTLTLKNDQMPSGTSLPEHQVASVLEVKADIVFILETMGLILFDSQVKEIETPKKKDTETLPSEDQTFYMTLSKDISGNSEVLRGLLYVRNGAFVLKEGSYIRKEAHPSFHNHEAYYELWKQVMASDAVRSADNQKVVLLVKDVEFKSPSAAGAVVRGRTTNGRTDWRRIADDKSLNEVLIDE